MDAGALENWCPAVAARVTPAGASCVLTVGDRGVAVRPPLTLDVAASLSEFPGLAQAHALGGRDGAELE